MLAVSVPYVVPNSSSLVLCLFAILSREGNASTEIFFGFSIISKIFNTEVISVKNTKYAAVFFIPICAVTARHGD